MTEEVKLTAEDAKSVPVSIRQAVIEKVGESHSLIKQQLIEQEAAKEADKLRETLSTGFHSIESLKQELRKLEKPDLFPAGFGRDGKPLGEGSYSKERAEKIKKTDEVLDRWEKGLELAWNKGDFAKLKELAKNPPKVEA
jgi:hypothetical protein